ncbi:MAG: STAS domain-containing protein [Thiohalophilus sp.]|uniref:STAS domain-containing protein n=1 Tax=Thiohalophilus sp. TaxID=3028392 RepID=UPI00286FF3C2|nr:STAS domain-containing protein [Thiohalophilus sp.]MDR9436563.1 STAS domain-containing protein [Thiohalophilus sp.]
MSDTAIKPQDDNSYLISGELNMQTVPGLLQQVEPILGRSQGEVCFDLQAVTRSDSAGLALLVEWMQFARQQDRKLTFRNLPDQLRDIARISGLEDLLPLS